MGTEATTDVEPTDVDPASLTVKIEDSSNTASNDEPTQEDFEACQPIIESSFAKDGPQTENVSTEVRDCCALTAAYYDALTFNTDVPSINAIDQWTHRYECCDALEWRDGSMACTPWGPPTPPNAHRMKRRIIVHAHQKMG